MCVLTYVLFCMLEHTVCDKRNCNILSHCIPIDGMITKVQLSLTAGLHFEMAGIQQAMQLRAAYQHFGPPAEHAAAQNAFNKPAAHGMTSKMCSRLTVLLFLSVPFPKLAFSVFVFQPWIAVIRLDFPHACGLRMWSPNSIIYLTTAKNSRPTVKWSDKDTCIEINTLPQVFRTFHDGTTCQF